LRRARGLARLAGMAIACPQKRHDRHGRKEFAAIGQATIVRAAHEQMDMSRAGVANSS